MLTICPIVYKALLAFLLMMLKSTALLIGMCRICWNDFQEPQSINNNSGIRNWAISGNKNGKYYR